MTLILPLTARLVRWWKNLRRKVWPDYPMLYWTGDIVYVGPKTPEEWEEYFSKVKPEVNLFPETPDEWYAKHNRDYVIHD